MPVQRTDDRGAAGGRRVDHGVIVRIRNGSPRRLSWIDQFGVGCQEVQVLTNIRFAELPDRTDSGQERTRSTSEIKKGERKKVDELLMIVRISSRAGPRALALARTRTFVSRTILMNTLIR